jgi:putative nucleotidyltransferase with HDIG domain
MELDQDIRRGVIAALPEAAEIRDAALREKVYDAWTLALMHSTFRCIEDIPSSGVPGSPPMKGATQADHLRSVARLAAATARDMRDNFAGFAVDMDEIWAGGLCHDLGKPFEFDPDNQARWRANPAACGLPSLRHTIYGAHIALTAGLSESIAHIAACHSLEGQHVQRSLAAEIIHHADETCWRVLGKAGLLEG